MPNLEFFNDNKLAVIPVHPRSKSTSVEGWPQRRAKDNDPTEFEIESNYGVVLGTASDNLVDIDLDCDLARQLAPYFLPSTGWIFGRKTAQGSHYLYRVQGDTGATKKFRVDGGKFAEYRANGAYTVFPPSIHQDTGEQIKFETQTGPASTTREKLLNSLSMMSVCAILHPFYQEGSRHDLVLCLAGTLLVNGKSTQDVMILVEALATITGDEEAPKRRGAVRDTENRLKEGQAVSQLGQLKALISETALQQLVSIVGIKTPADVPTGTSSAALPSDDQNDTGVAKLFAAKVADDVIYHKRIGCFFICRNGLWRPDEQGIEVTSKFDAFVQDQLARLRSDASGISHDLCAAQSRFLLKYRNRPNARNAIEQSKPFLSVDTSIDEHDDFIAVGNGLLNLNDGSLSPLQPKHYITRQLSVDFEPDAKCPHFEQVLSDAFGVNADLIDYMQGLMGYWLTGRTDRQEIYIFHGSGANGKSTILNAISHVLGPFAGSMMGETIFEGSSSGQHNSDLGSLQDYRFTVVHEAESKFKLNSARLKQLTGQDWIKVRPLYKNPITFKPKFKIVVVCNKRPNLDAYDEALKRRIKLIPFDHVVPREDRNPKLGELLESEASGILNFMIEGALRYFDNRIEEPAAVKRATESYLYDQDSVSSFLSDCAEKNNNAAVSKNQLYEAYIAYCADETMDAISKRDFGLIMKKMGFEDVRSSSERKWKGLNLIDQTL